MSVVGWSVPPTFRISLTDRPGRVPDRVPTVSYLPPGRERKLTGLLHPSRPLCKRRMSGTLCSGLSVYVPEGRFPSLFQKTEGRHPRKVLSCGEHLSLFHPPSSTVSTTPTLSARPGEVPSSQRPCGTVSQRPLFVGTVLRSP